MIGGGAEEVNDDWLRCFRKAPPISSEEQDRLHKQALSAAHTEVRKAAVVPYTSIK